MSPKKAKKKRFLKSTYLFLQKKFHETLQIFTIDYAFNSKCAEKIFSFYASLD